jgi:hypothetical protein
MRRAALIAVVCVLAGGLGASDAPAAIKQPPQPKSGPGGSNYTHAGWRVSSGGSGADAWYVFEPARPRPTSAPLSIVMHGYYEFAGYDQMYELLRHTVRRGTSSSTRAGRPTSRSHAPGHSTSNPA